MFMFLILSPPIFNGDVEQFSWWKNKLYGHVITLDEELWDAMNPGYFKYEDVPVSDADTPHICIHVA